MEDIRLASLLMVFVSIAAALVTWRVFRKAGPRTLDVAAVAVVGAVVAYLRLVWGQLWIVRWIPLPSVIVLGNWFPPLSAVLAALVWLRLSGGSVLRRLLVSGVLLAAGGISVLFFVAVETPVCDEAWDPPMPPIPWPVCRQTTNATCSAAAAATLLNTVRIETTEQEMADLCLTGGGTTWLGLYHGLSTKLQGHEYHVQFFENSPDLSRLADFQRPALLCCELTVDDAESFPQYVIDGGWIPGTPHSVIYFGRLGPFHLIGDPSRGMETWSDEALSVLWSGSGLRLVSLEEPAVFR